MDSDMDQAKGKIKQAAGDLTGDEQVKQDGKTDENAGKAKDVIAKAKDKLDDTVDAVKNKLHKD